MGYVLKYSSGLFVSNGIAMTGSGLINTEGVSLSEARVTPIHIAQRAKWTLKDQACLDTVVCEIDDNRNIVRELIEDGHLWEDDNDN